MPGEEKRRRRSSDPLIAARYQLEQVVHDFELDTCVLVDDSGRLVQAPGLYPEFEEALARETPRLANGSTCRLLFARLNRIHRVRPNQVSACEFRAGGRRWYVAAVGSMSTMREVGVFRAILGLRRIEKHAAAA